MTGADLPGQGLQVQPGTPTTRWTRLTSRGLTDAGSGRLPRGTRRLIPPHQGGRKGRS